MVEVRYKLFFLFLFTTISYAEVIELKPLVKYALKNSAKILLSEKYKEIEESKLDLAYSSLYPSISFQYDLENQRYNYDAGNSYKSARSSVGASFDYTLYDFDQYQELDILKQNIKIKELEHNENIIELKKEVVRDYFDVLLSSRKIEIKEQIKDIQQNIYNTNKRLYRAHMISKVELQNSVIKLSQVQNELLNLEVDYEDKLSDLSRVTTMKISSYDKFQLPSTTTYYQKLTFDNSNISKLYEHKIRQKHIEISKESGVYLPTVSLSGEYQNFVTSNDSMRYSIDSMKDKSYTTSATIKWVLFEGFEADKNRKRLELELKALELEKQIAQDKFNNSLSKRVHNYNKRKDREDMVSKINTDILNQAIVLDRLDGASELGRVSLLEKQIESLESILIVQLEDIESRRKNILLNLEMQGVL
jgi:outer membrane protein TolC